VTEEKTIRLRKHTGKQTAFAVYAYYIFNNDTFIEGR
jgi:hypothetical protein